MIKRLTSLLVLLIFITAAAYCEDMSAATPTDISEEIIAEELFDINELYGNRDIELYFIKTPKFIDDTAILGFNLINYPPIEIQQIQWQISTDNINWVDIEGANDETYEFIVTRDNYTFWWRVQITYKVKR